MVWTRLVLRKEITPGALLVFLAYLKIAYRPFRILPNTRPAGQGLGCRDRVVDLLERVAGRAGLPGAVRAPAFAGHIRIEE